ncbi:MAG: Lrp/AsnC family transcriptional regulator [Candidatus Bathyarchaeia archaeon]
MVASDSYQIDELDSKIIRLLSEDGRRSFREIADILKVAVGTAYNRIKRLEDLGIIKAYTVSVDYQRLGYELTALTLIQAEGQHLTEVEKEAASHGAVSSVYDITGDFDIAVIARFRNRADLNVFIKTLLKNPHVKRTVTNIILNVVKEGVAVDTFDGSAGAMAQSSLE